MICRNRAMLLFGDVPHFLIASPFASIILGKSNFSDRPRGKKHQEVAMTRRVLVQSAVLLLVVGATWNTKASGSITVFVPNVGGYVTGPSEGLPSNVAINDFLAGQLSYNAAQTETGLTTNSMALYNESGTTDAASSPSGSIAHPRPRRPIRASYIPTTTAGPAPPPTLSRLRGGATSLYTATNLPLPNQYGIPYFIGKNGSLNWGFDPICAEVQYWTTGDPAPQFASVPEPSTMVVVLSVAIGTAGSWISRRRRLRLSST